MTPIVQFRKSFGGYLLNVTTYGYDNLPPEVNTALIVRTVRLWLYIARAIKNGEKDLAESVAFRSVETSVEEDFEGTQIDQSKGGYVTVFDWNHELHLTLHSNDLAQPLLDLFYAQAEALTQLVALFPDAQQTAVEGSPRAGATPPPTNTPPPPVNPVEGAIVATRLPTPNTPQYADGQLVSFTIVKIEAGAEKGSPVFKLWSSLGGRYASHTIYKLDTKGQPKKDYELMLPVLSTLKLDFEHPQATGTWRLVVRAQHAEKEGKVKEYQNPVSFTPI